MATSRLGRWLIASSTVLVIVGASIVPLLTPAYVRLEQDRAGAGALTGFTPAQLDTVTGALLGDLVLWRSDFDVAVHGAPVLTDRERSHMRDVRGVFAGLGLLVAAAIAVLVLAFRRSRDAAARNATWRAIGNGARALVVATVVLGTLAALAFEAVFEVFHRLFFSAGTWTFDPRTDRLVQLFPGTFWSETTIVLGVILLVVALGTAWFSAQRVATARITSSLATSRAGT